MSSPTKLRERAGERTLGTLLAERARDDPAAPAIVSPEGESLPAAELLRRVEAVHEALSANGVDRSDRVAVVAELGPDAAVAVLGVASWGTCVPVSPSANAELSALLAETGARAVMAPHGAGATERAAVEARGVLLLDGPDMSVRGGGSGNGGPAPARVDAQSRPDDVSLLLRTSGSTGKPKLVPATHRQLFARADAAQRLMRLGATDACLNPMPLCYGHGLYTGLLFPLLTGGSTILPDRFDEESFMAALRELSPTWYTAGPAHQQAILGWLKQRPGGAPTGGLRFARCANASLPGELREGLEALLGVPVLESYGTSEAGMIASPDPFGPRKDGTVGTPAGVDVAVLDESGAVLPPRASGEIVVRGPTVFSGYVGDPELSRRSLTDDGWLRTGDLGSLDEDGFLLLEGRVDDVINRGGEKVSPIEVEAALLRHPDVAEAVVFAVAHPTLGHEVGAAVTLSPGQGAAEDALRNHLGESLATFKVPRRIVVLSELPVGPTGKPLRDELAERWLELAPEPLEGARLQEEPGPLVRQLAGLWAEILERGPVGPDDDFFDLGGDSLAAVALVGAVAEELDVELELADVIGAPTPRRLARVMLRGSYLQDHSPARDVIGVNTSGGQPPLFAVGGRPGYAMRILLVGRELGPQQPVYGLQPPGMDWQAVGAQTIPEMAAHYLARVREEQPRGPYRLLGSSFGGLIVFEMALQLERSGAEVEFLGLIDTEPARVVWRPDTDTLPHSLEDLDPAPEGSSSSQAAGTRVAASHVEARSSYAIAERTRCEITLFQCTGDGVVAGGDRRALWADASTGGLRLLQLPGLHAAFDCEPQFSVLRDALRTCLTGSSPPGLDPSVAFDRTYRLERTPAGEEIRGGDGRSFVISEGAMQGRVRRVRSRRGKLLLRGWAGEPGHQRPGETVVAFVGGRYAGYSTCGAPTEAVARRHSAPGLRHAGFRLRLEEAAAGVAFERPRVFALAAGARASELRVMG